MTAISFQYKVRDTLGNYLQGAVHADTAEAATQQLRREGFQVVELAASTGDAEGLFPRRVRRAEIVYVTAQLAVMVDTGVTLSAALDNIIAQEENPTLRNVLKSLQTAVQQGDDFSSALARFPKYFDKTYVSLIKASEATGSLGPMLDRVAGYLRKELETRSKIRAAMAYPSIMSVMAVAVTIFLLTFVLPKFTPLFTRKGMQLPKPTRILMWLSDALSGYWYLWIIVALALILGFIFGRRTPNGRRAWDWLKINMPLLGTICRKVTISRSIRTLGALVSSGIPMLDALQLSADVTGNVWYEELWQRVSRDVTEGKQICESLAGNPLFPSMLVQMISAGEQTGQLGSVLERVSNFYDQEVETSLKTATSLIEPLMITLMGGVVGGIALALMLPIFQLSKSPG